MQEREESRRSPMREAQEARERRRKRSLLAGTVGLGALFGGGIVIIVLPGWIVPSTIVMLVGVVLLAVAFFLAPGSTFARLARHLNDRQIRKE